MVIHSSANGHLGRSHFLALMGDVAMNIPARVCLNIPFPSPLGIYVGEELLCHVINSMTTISVELSEELPDHFPKGLQHFTCPPAV